jgi:hypothetical protein
MNVVGNDQERRHSAEPGSEAESSYKHLMTVGVETADAVTDCLLRSLFGLNFVRNTIALIDIICRTDV